MPNSVKLSVLAVFLFTGAIGLPGAEFQKHVIDNFRSGYQVAVADVNGDGRPDVIALSTDANRVAWYENPSWSAHLIAQTPRNIDLAPRRIEGHFGLALATGFYFADSHRGGQILWLEPGEGTNVWTSYPVGIDPVPHRLRWGDLDGDGRPELVHAPIFGPGSDQAVAPTPSHLWAFRPPTNLHQGEWTVWKIDESLTVLHGIYVGDLDRDGRDEILTASFEGVHRFAFKGKGLEARWIKTKLGEGAAPKTAAPGEARGSSEVAPGKVRGLKFIATVEPWHGNMVVIYTERNEPGLWQRRVLDDSLKEAHALLVTDLNQDGQDEIVVGWRGGTGGVAIYKATDDAGNNWEKQVVDQAITVDGMAAADLNGDGRLDLVALAGRSGVLVWYEQVK